LYLLYFAVIRKYRYQLIINTDKQGAKADIYNMYAVFCFLYDIIIAF